MKVVSVTIGALLVWVILLTAVPVARSPLPADRGQATEWKSDLSVLTSQQREFVLRVRSLPADQRESFTFCLAEGTPQEYAEALNEAQFPGGRPRYEHANRWPGGQGDPISLTYSFVPDGVTVPANAGLSGGTNQIFSMMNGVFGSPAVWQGLFAQCFSEWDQLSGIDYTQVSDDGAALFGSPGSATRGDVRVSAISLDGANGVLAYNNFPGTDVVEPGGGDMVIDADDGANWANSANNYRFLRNVITHEHGHGIGLMHVCPDNGTKLMEPYIILSFDGAQHDDVRSAQRHYGDALEANDFIPAATDLGPIVDTSVSQSDLSIDDNGDNDYFAFDLLAGAQVSATMTPVGMSYQTGAQVFIGCWFASPTTINSLTIHNLNIALIGPDGSTVLANGNTHAAGQAESISGYTVGAAGTYYLRVYPATTTNDIQLYNLQVSSSGGSQDIPGDIDDDGDVDYVDRTLFINVLLGTETTPSYVERADLTNDGVADGNDTPDFITALLD